MSLLPASFLFRIQQPCQYVKGLPALEGERMLDLPESCRLMDAAALNGRKAFADVRIAWNAEGFGIQFEVRGKENPPVGDVKRRFASDGMLFWLDTRDARDNHRATRYCHHFWFMPAGGGEDLDEPAAGQAAINRAMQNAPECSPEAIPLRTGRIRRGYWLEAWLPATVLNGFDPETNPRLGIYYWIRDTELGDQPLGVGPEFPFYEDPSLWWTVELVR